MGKPFYSETKIEYISKNFIDLNKSLTLTKKFHITKNHLEVIY